jgi:hypothetical protein
MTTGMVVGMVVSMAAVGSPITLGAGALLGVETSLVVLAAVYLANVLIKRRVPKWTT